MMRGIDVSTWQGRYIDYKKVKKSGVSFVIIRAGFGRETSQKDDCFETNYKNAKAAGLLVGAYWYSYAVSAEDAVREAETCMKCIQGKKFDLPIFLDLEEQSQFAKGKNFCDSIVKSFCDTISKGGYKTGLYISYSPLMNYISETVRNKYTLWIAQYFNKCQYTGKYAVWQHTDSAKIDGIDGSVDENYLYDTSIILGNLITTSESKTTADTTVDVMYRTYADGRWLPWVKNLEDYAGLENKPIQGVQIKVSKGHIRYRVKLVGSNAYLPWVTDTKDYAGIYGRNIDRIQVQYIGEDYKVKYRTSTVNSNKYLPWVTEYNLVNENGYAGITGVAADKLQIQLIKG